MWKDPSPNACALENALAQRFGLAFCRVAPDLGEGDLPLKALALEGASFLRQILERGEDKVIGVGHGRTLAAVVEQLPQTPAPDVKFVSLLGGLTRKFAANPFDVIHRLAERTGAEAYLLPVPGVRQFGRRQGGADEADTALPTCSRWRARPRFCSSASVRSVATAFWCRAA